MIIKHQVTFSKNDKRRKVFEKLGVRVENAGTICSFLIMENDPLWPEVKKKLKEKKIQSKSCAVFSQMEVLSAEWCVIFPRFISGYPMPDLGWEWKECSYTPEQECKDCGIGLRQKAPIHLKGEPKLGRNHFMGIFWMYDIFARNEVFEVLSQDGITGFEAYPAMHYKKKAPLKTIKQLKILKEHRPCIVNDNLVHDKTPCGHVKYNVLTRGMFKFRHDAFVDRADLIRTHEWFGSGHSAFQLVLASAKFVQLYMERKWRGLSLAPIELL